MDINNIVERVQAEICGRLALEQGNVNILLKYAARDGDHLEIGSLHGGSAIAVALAKKEGGFRGKVVCVDPFDGYYTGTKYECAVDPISGVSVSTRTITANAIKFGVDLEIVKRPSHPFPIQGRKFSTAYIDGNHWGIYPTLDFINASQCVTDFIILDNCEAKMRDVVFACDIADAIWIPELRKGITCVVKHP